MARANRSETVKPWLARGILPYPYRLSRPRIRSMDELEAARSSLENIRDLCGPPSQQSLAEVPPVWRYRLPGRLFSRERSVLETLDTRRGAHGRDKAARGDHDRRCLPSARDRLGPAAVPW